MTPSAEPVYLCAPVRTPIGRFGGALAPLTAAALGAHAARACLTRAGLAGPDAGAAAVDQAIFGHARQAGGGPNTARQIAYAAGVPVGRPALTVNQACGSGLQAVFAAARAIRLGEAALVLAGGTESMSNTPYLLPRARWGARLGDAELVDGMYRDGFDDPLSGLIMGETAEVLADEAGIDRAASDAWAHDSQQRCEAARVAGRFIDEIAPIEVPGRKGAVTTVDADEHPRDGVTLEKLARLKPVFRDDGRVTAGNASGITDGAAALLVASADAVARHDLPVAGVLHDATTVGVEPRIMGIGPVPAVDALRDRQAARGTDAIDVDAVDAVELNEAFACQLLACLAQLPFDPARVNPDGGAIALGHPIGATGARILVTLLHGLDRRDQRHGIATLCVSGGLGLAALVERPADARLRRAG